ncbi:CBS domain-containing protein [Nonomuraea dietziae]|uniref:CBS domain-containing protein n=1 Tax=Nonomuraea dietziae TaxID=65515 RepID=UPI00341E6EF1
MTIEQLSAGQIMSRVLVAVRPQESPLIAWELMRRAEVHHLPVVEDGHLVGILSREDIAGSWYGGPDVQSRRQVRVLLSRTPQPHVTPDEKIGRVAAAMLDSSLDAVPVLADGGRLVGMITTHDVLAAVAGRTPREQPPGEVVTGMFRLEPILPSEAQRA